MEYYGHMGIELRSDGSMWIRSRVEDEVMDNELITTYNVDKENTEKLFFVSGIDGDEREKKLYSLVGSAFGFEKYAITNEIHFTWQNSWDYSVPVSRTMSGTDENCFAREWM